jgi:hypothetical protein
MTWANDGHQYTSFGDGGGFEGTNTIGRVSLGFARVEGSSGDYDGINVWGGQGAEHPAKFGGKSYGMISIAGVLYAWWGPGSGIKSYTETRLLQSTNKGASWSKSSWDLHDTSSTMIMPTILNFGKDYAGARDGYVYHYFIRKQSSSDSLAVHKPGAIDLARVPKSQMMDLSAYRYFAGLDASKNPKWTASAANRKPVFQDPNGVGWCMSAVYNAGLKRYVIATEHTQSGNGNLGLFDAPNPWGPWTTVAYRHKSNGTQFGAGKIEPSTFFWNFSNKWTSADGKKFVMVFSGVDSNDAWNSVSGAFVTP